MNVEAVGGRWICRSKFEERHMPKEAGFRWDAEARYWFTTDGKVAARLMSPAEAAAAREADDAKYRLARASMEESIAADSPIEVPANEGLAYLGYQRAGIATIQKRRFVLLADEQGLGKTIQAIGYINLEPDIRKVLVVCPNSLRLNWLKEFQRWLVREYRIAVWNSEVCRPKYVDISILHYDAVHKYAAALREVQWDLIVLDEVHMLKNPEARRTRAVFGLDVRNAKRLEKIRQNKLASLLPGASIPKDLRDPVEVIPPLRGRAGIGMTGTPLPNRPKEVWPCAHWLDPVNFRSFSKFKVQFCAAEWSEYGMDDNGSSNRGELQTLLRSTIMVRRLKRDVMKELPPKRRCIVEIPHKASKVVQAEMDAFRVHEASLAALRRAADQARALASDKSADYAAAVRALKTATLKSFAELSKQRHDTAIAKLPYVIEHLRSIVYAGEKLVVFAHHHEVVEAIAAEFGAACVTCYGRDGVEQRQRNVDRFQTDPECLVIAGSYGPMGTGWTLTASSHVVAAELDWVPGNMSQAEDRVHRIGQDAEMVLVEHLVLQGSLDAHMAAIVVEKQEVQSEILDMEAPEGIADTPPQLAPVAPTPAPRPVAGPPPPARTERPAPKPLPAYRQVGLFEEFF